LPEVRPGDDLAGLIGQGIERAGLVLEAGDLIVLAQKIVSKAEGCFVALAAVSVSDRARALATVTGKDARYIQVVLDQSRAVLRAVPGVLVVEDHRGFVMANAGIDQSNVPGDDQVLCLPRDPDASAARLRTALEQQAGVPLAVLINDSFGRAWRNGVVGTALGSSGLQALGDQRGNLDREGRPLRITQVAYADELAAAASLVMGQGAEGTPVVHVRGVAALAGSGTVRELLRDPRTDLFR
jgi:coenzyme F420-0:L-glutamate ligase/coenzyme F420-1:gamma-L-glutamate ligase